MNRLQQLPVRERMIVVLIASLLVAAVWAPCQVINEFMADNGHCITDASNEFEDWVELYNNTPDTIDIADFYLTDDFNQPDKWKVPDNDASHTTMEPGGHLLIWCDEDVREGTLHASFKLDADGEQIGLYKKDGRTPVDRVSFAYQKENVSTGRAEDGGDEWRYFTYPTPGTCNSDIPRFYIQCDPDSFEYMYEHFLEDHYIPITLTFAGRTWTDVQMRIRGDSSRGFPKKSLKLKFIGEPFVNGHDVLNFNADYYDLSYVHTVLSSSLMKKSGQPCFDAEHVRLYCNGSYIGLYIAVENMDEAFLEKNGFDPDGNLYKATVDGACMSRYDEPYYHWEKKTNSGDARNDLIELIDSVNDVHDAQYHDFIQRTFDYEKLVTLFAMNILLNNGSTYYHNYYLYHDLHGSGKWTLFPWDLDLTFNGYHPDLAWDRSSNSETSDNPLFERAVMDSRMLSDIKARIDELHTSFFNIDSLSPVIDSLTNRILSPVMEDSTDSIADTATFNLHLLAVRHHLEKRYACLQEQFAHRPSPFYADPFPRKEGDSLVFSWHPSTDPDGDELSYIFTYGTLPDLSLPSAVVVSGITDTTFSLTSHLPPDVYFWSVSVSDNGDTVTGFNSWNIIALYHNNLYLTLPQYMLNIAPEYLAQMHADNMSDTYYPATFVHKAVAHSCSTRFRGTSSRTLWKKSYRIKFPDRDNPFGVKTINLNAEYRDRSMMRNHLAMRLFEFKKLPAPRTRYVNLFINGSHKGVYLHVESVNKDFLVRNGRKSNTMYKAVTHGATMAPIVHNADFLSTWEKKLGKDGDHTAIRTLFNKLQYWTNEDFTAAIADVFNVEDVLAYFAVQLALVSIDGMTKNMYCYHNPETDTWELFPWDMDVTFGNDLGCTYDEFYEELIYFDHFCRNVLIQRLIENPAWDRKFAELYQHIVNEGFDFLNSEIDSVYRLIKADIYQDSNKICTNQEFDGEIELLKRFLLRRKYKTDTLTGLNRAPFSDVYVSNPMPSPGNPYVTVRVRSNTPFSMKLLSSVDVDFDSTNRPYTERKQLLYDDGQHDDLRAGDRVYGTTFKIANDYPLVVPFAFRTLNYCFPPNGLFYINYIPTKTFSLAPQKTARPVGELVAIGDIYRIGEGYAVTLVNTSGVDVNLSYTVVESGEYYNRFVVPENFILPAYSRAILAESHDIATAFFPAMLSVEDFFLHLKTGDTISLLSPTYDPIVSKPIRYIQTTARLRPAEIVFNEINYHSSQKCNSGDWIELHNPGEYAICLSGWSLQNTGDSSRYFFPEDRFINPSEFYIICENRKKFTASYRGTEGDASVDEFDFNLRGDNETLELFDRSGARVNRLSFSSRQPWPPEPDGKGPTLSFINGDHENEDPDFWEASKITGGTPGRPNDLSPEQVTIVNSGFKKSIHVSLLEVGDITITIYNMKGALVRSITKKRRARGRYTYCLDNEDLGPGLYLLQIMVNGRAHSMSRYLAIR